MSKYVGINQEIAILADSPLNNLLLGHPVPIFYHQIFVSYSKVPFWNEHYAFFQRIARILELSLPSDFSNFARFLVRLVNKSKFFKGAMVKIIFFPDQSSFQFISIPQKVDYERFSLIKKMVFVQKTFNLKPDNNLNFVRGYDLHHYNILKAISSNKTFLVVDNFEKVIESQLGNLVLIEKKNVYSPNYQSGAFFNAIQQKVLEILQHMGFSISIRPVDFTRFETASEVWIINDMGIYSRVGIGNLRYHYGNLSEKVFEKLMELYDKERVWI